MRTNKYLDSQAATAFVFGVLNIGYACIQTPVNNSDSPQQNIYRYRSDWFICPDLTDLGSKDSSILTHMLNIFEFRNTEVASGR